MQQSAGHSDSSSVPSSSVPPSTVPTIAQFTSQPEKFNSSVRINTFNGSPSSASAPGMKPKW